MNFSPRQFQDNMEKNTSFNAPLRSYRDKLCGCRVPDEAPRVSDVPTECCKVGKSMMVSSPERTGVLRPAYLEHPHQGQRGCESDMPDK